MNARRQFRDALFVLWALATYASQPAWTDEQGDHLDLARRRSYVSDMRLAQRAWEDIQIDRLVELLDGQRPDKTGGIDVRGFEWHFLHRRCHSDLRTIQGQSRSQGPRRVTFSPDGKRLVLSGSYPPKVQVWDIVTNREIVVRNTRHHVPPNVSFSPDGERLTFASWVFIDAARKELTIRDALSDKKIVTLPVSGGSLDGIAFSPDGKLIAAAVSTPAEKVEHTVWIWELPSGKEMLSIRGKYQIYELAFSPDGTRLAALGSDQFGRVWDTGTGETILDVATDPGDAATVAFSPDGKWLAAAGSKGTVRVLDATSGQVKCTLEGHADYVFGVAFSPDGRRLASAGRDKTVRLWDAQSGREIRVFKGHTHEVSSVTFSPDGRLLASADRSDGTVKIWDTVTDPEAIVFRDPTRGVDSMSFSPDGTRVVSDGHDKVRIWDSHSGQDIFSLDPPADPSTPKHTTDVVFSPNGKWLATAHQRIGVPTRPEDLSIVAIWDAATGRQIDTFKAGYFGITGFPVFCLAFSPDSRLLALGYGAHCDGVPCPIKVWDVPAAGKGWASAPRYILKGHPEWITCVTFSPDGKRLASADFNGSVLLWDMAAGRQMFRLKGFVETDTQVAFSPDGTRLAGCEGNTINLWDTATGQVVLKLKGHNVPVRCVAFSPDGKRLASATADLYERHGEIKLWDLADGQETLSFKASIKGINGLAFSPDGLRLASASGGTVKIWDARPLTDELRLEREAISLLEFARQRLMLKQEIIKHIRQETTVSEPVRQAALALAERYRGDPDRLRQASWHVVRGADASSEDYRRALRWAEAASHGQPDKGTFLTTLGIAQYRAGQYQEGLATLQRMYSLIPALDQAKLAEDDALNKLWRSLPDGMKIWDVPAGVAFLAMTHYRLDQKEQALAHLQELRGLMEHFNKIRWGEDRDRRPFLQEAEMLIQGHPGEPEGTGPPPAKNDPPEPLPKPIIEAWKKAGAEIGWMGGTWGDYVDFLGFLIEEEGGEAGELPAFLFPAEPPTPWKEGLLANLPAPAAAFGLSLNSTQVTDAALQELRKFQNLQALDLLGTPVTDVGLKEVGRLNSLQALDLTLTNVTDAGLKELAGLKNLRALYLGPEVTDAGLKELAGMQELRTLSLAWTQVTDVGLKELAGLKNLQTLNLTDTRVTDAALKELARLANLETLILTDTKVTDAGLNELAGLKLKKLEIPGSAKTDLGLRHYLAAIEPPTTLTLGGWEWKVTDAGLKELAGLKSLQSLDLNQLEVTDAGLKELAGLTSLQKLQITSPKVTDAGLKHLAGLTNLQELWLAGIPVTDAGLKQLAGLKNLQTMSIGGPKVTDAGLKELAGFKSLQTLYLRGKQVTGEGLKDLAGLEKLKFLSLSGSKVSDAGLKELAGIRSLQTLSLAGAQLTGADLKALAGLENLQVLDLSDSKVTNAELKGLAGLRNLQDLNLSGTQVMDEGLQELAGLKSLRWLYLVDTQVTDVGLKHLLGLKNLQTLQLEGTSVTDEGLKVLAGLKSLQDLNVIATNVTDAGPKELQKTLPDIVISY